MSSNRPYLEHLFNNYSPDLIALSEHWLHDYSTHTIQSLHPDYKFKAVCPPRKEHPIFCTPHLLRGHGGVALGWHTRLDHLINPTPIISTHQVIGIELKTSPSPLFIFSVYLPSRSGCTDVFRESLDQIDAAIGTLPSTSTVIILGDFNADPGIHGGPYSTTRLNEQGRILLHYMARWNLISTHLHTPNPNTSSSHTFESEAHSTLSTIDHIMCHQSQIPMIQSSRLITILTHRTIYQSLHPSTSLTYPDPLHQTTSAQPAPHSLLETGHVLLIMTSNPSTTHPSINHCMSCSTLSHHHQFYRKTQVSWTNISPP